MSENVAELSVARLVEGGFARTGQWSLDAGGMLFLSGEAPKKPGVYAFVVDGTAQYVGVASASLTKRLYFYAKPGSTQRTNMRLNAVLLDASRRGQVVEVFVAVPPDAEWNGWAISGPEGLEAGIIKRFHLPWNVRGAVSLPAAGARSTQSTASPAERGLRAKPLSRAGDKYRPLRDHLSACTQDKVSMTFAQIEALVGPLPKSAGLHRAWWANHEGNSQAKGWMPARYLAEPNPSHRSVVFRRFSR